MDDHDERVDGRTGSDHHAVSTGRVTTVPRNTVNGRDNNTQPSDWQLLREKTTVLADFNDRVESE